ncbi:hypothetical protein KCP69_17180 [Salmonella enterica subsp. enterica]|nr:hypothetical protein KCP69_17180 [Salmonella enterica subsp. enterica]
MVDSRGRALFAASAMPRSMPPRFPVLCGDDPVLWCLLRPLALIIGENRHACWRCGIPVWLLAAPFPQSYSVSRSATCFRRAVCLHAAASC